MEISVVQAFLIGITYYLGTVGTPWLTTNGSFFVLGKPLVAGTVVGIILGDPVQGCIIGATINLPYIAFISAGGTVPVDPGIAGTLGTALALASGVSPSVATTIAVPIGLLGTIIWVIHMTVDVYFVHMCDKAAEEGDLDKISFLHVVPPQIFMFLICVIPVTLGAYYGGDTVKTLVDALSGKPLHILEVIGQMLPALGIAMVLRSITRQGSLLLFLAGFLMHMYLELDIIAIALFAAIIAFFYTTIIFDEGGTKINE